VSGDPVASLATLADFTVGAFKDLVSDYPEEATQEALNEATRLMEDITSRRLAPFTGLTETVRVDTIPPDEHAQVQVTNPRLPRTPPAGFDPVLNAQVRHCWLLQRPPRYPDLWTYDVTGIMVSGANPYSIPAGQILYGPDDEGHMWFQPGQYLAAGSRIQPTYGGGYTAAIPATLVRCCKYFAAAFIIRELNPDTQTPDPDALYSSAEKILTDGKWIRDPSGR
jgi:hypothetical protein